MIRCRYFLSVLFSCLFFADYASEQQKEVQADFYLSCLTSPINPHTTLIAFDLHDVVFRRNLSEVMWRTLGVTCRGMIFYALNPFFWYKARKCGAGTEITENVYKKLTAEYPGLIRFQEDFYAVANAHRPIPEMIEIIDTLKALGYSLYILSNIGGDTFQAFKAKYPEILGKFDGAYTPCTANNYNHKPNMSFFTEFKNYVAGLGHDNKQIVFIDDMKKNLDGARACSIAGVHCTSTQRVKNTLEQLRVLPTIASTEKDELPIAEKF
jgi:FMN phosphatase YigB (HAD superfamily)